MKKRKKKPLTIENRWDILYRDYPEVYDEFARVRKKPRAVEIINKHFDIKDKVVVDIGSGSGKQTFLLAKHCKKVIGVEPEAAMRRIANKEVKKRKLKNVVFKKGEAEKIPLKKDSVDLILGFTMVGLYTEKRYRNFINEAKRVLKKGGSIIMLTVAPSSYGGDLPARVFGKHRKSKFDGLKGRIYPKLGFKHKDYYSVQDYKTLKKIISTYGFIFGTKAIEYIKKHKRTKIKWKWRVYYKKF